LPVSLLVIIRKTEKGSGKGDSERSQENTLLVEEMQLPKGLGRRNHAPNPFTLVGLSEGAGRCSTGHSASDAIHPDKILTAISCSPSNGGSCGLKQRMRRNAELQNRNRFPAHVAHNSPPAVFFPEVMDFLIPAVDG
jgi:hypothetical protein